MGNTESKNASNFSKKIQNDALRMQMDYDRTILYDDLNQECKRDVTSGISTSYIITTEDGTKINIWYDISFVSLLRERKKLIENWIKSTNELKDKNKFYHHKKSSFKFINEKNKEIYEKNHFVTKEPININEIRNLGFFPKNISYYDREKYFKNNLKSFFNLHGFRGNNDIRKSLLNLVKAKSGRCTTGFLTFINVLNPKTERIITCDENEKFYIKCIFSYEDPDELEVFNKKIKEIKERTRKEIISPIAILYDDYMKESKFINISYTYLGNGKEIQSSFRWEVPINFFEDANEGDIIELTSDDLPIDVEIKLDRICMRHCKEEISQIKKPNKIKKSYEFRFNENSYHDINKFIQDAVENFIFLKNTNL